MGGEKIKLILIILFLILISFPVLSEDMREGFFTIGSEFMVLKNPSSYSLPQTQIIIPYDNTNIFIDINNDGTDDYAFKFNKGGPYNLTTIWQITDGSRLTSDKPIYYYQSILFYNNLSVSPNYLTINKYLSVPPIDNYANEYYILNGTYRFLSKENTTISIDENIDGTIDKQYNTKNSPSIQIANFAKIYSNSTFFGYSSDSVTSPQGNDFFISADRTYLIVGFDNTNVEVDMNMDTNTDYTYTLNKGVYNFTLIPGARISSSKEIVCFDYYRYMTKNYDFSQYTKTFFPCKRTMDISNEFFVYSPKNNHVLVGLFNNESYETDNYSATLKNLEGGKNFTDNLTSNMKKNMTTNFYSVLSTTPLIDSLEYAEIYGNPPASSYYVYSAGSLIAYKKPYLMVKPKSKVLTPNSNAIFSIRIFNPLQTSSLKNIKVNFPVNCGLSLQAPVANYKKEYIEGGLIEQNSKTIIEDTINNQIIFEYSGSLESESFLDIDLVFMAPSEIQTCSLGKATFSYSTDTWII